MVTDVVTVAADTWSFPPPASIRSSPAGVANSTISNVGEPSMLLSISMPPPVGVNDALSDVSGSVTLILVLVTPVRSIGSSPVNATGKPSNAITPSAAPVLVMVVNSNVPPVTVSESMPASPFQVTPAPGRADRSTISSSSAVEPVITKDRPGSTVCRRSSAAPCRRRTTSVLITSSSNTPPPAGRNTVCPVTDSIDNCVAARLPLPASSRAALAAMLTVTVPSAGGITSKVKTRLFVVAKFADVPLPILKSPATNPLTTSPKSTDTLMGDSLVGLDCVAVITGSGAVRSLVNVN